MTEKALIANRASALNEAELRVDLLGGSRISLYGGDNGDRLRGLGLDGVVLDEYADIPPSLFPQVVRPALADPGGFAVIIGTVRGRNHLWQTYEAGRADPGWYTALMRASATGQLSQEELLSARQTMTEEQYSSEFECDPFAATTARTLRLVKRKAGLQTYRRSRACRFIPHGTSVTDIRPQSGSFRWQARK